MVWQPIGSSHLVLVAVSLVQHIAPLLLLVSLRNKLFHCKWRTGT